LQRGHDPGIFEQRFHRETRDRNATDSSREEAMGAINYGRVILGGLAAGLVLNVVDFVVQGIVLQPQWDEVMRSLGRPPMTGSQIGVFVVMDFLYGVALAYLYAAVRPRMGAGPKAALCTGVFLWTIVGLIGVLGMVPMGIFPARLLVIGSATALPAYAAAGLLAGWLYREN
jgi:hypothetical protein